jgi:hypothetical protein
MDSGQSRMEHRFSQTGTDLRLGFQRRPKQKKLLNYSNSARSTLDCLIIDCRVPVLIASWLGTGTVIVLAGNFFCMTTWLPRRRTSLKPCLARIEHTCLPERILSLTNSDLNLRYENLATQSLLNFLSRGRLKKQFQSLL